MARQTRAAWLLLAFIAAAWVLPGIFAHGPWKQDETYTFGIIHHMLVSGDYLVPTNAGEPFMEKPPLYYWTALLFAKAFYPLLEYHDGARLASVFYNLVTLFFVARIAQLIWSERKLLSLPVLGTVALFAGSPGMVKHAHDMFTDVALVCGGASATYGLLAIALNEQRRTQGWSAAFWFGLGVGVTEMTKGLFIPLTFAATALGVGLLVRECRTLSYWKMVGAAVLVSLPFFVIWPALLAAHSVPLFMEWFWDNNVGRFFGFSVAKLGSDNDHAVILRALSGFALPGSILAVLALAQGDWRKIGAPRVALPAAFVAVSLAVLQSSATARQLYLLPVLLPLIMLGARAVPRLPDWMHISWDWFARIGFGLLAAVIWATYIVSTLPLEYHHWIAYFGKWLPLNFITPFQPLALAGAAAMTLCWVWGLNKFRLGGKWRGAFSWFAGITLMWGLAYTLLLPWGDYAKSYEYVYGDLKDKMSQQWKAGDCMASKNLGESEAPMLYYYTNILHQPIDSINRTQCNWVILQTPGRAPLPEGNWTPFWEGRRDGDDAQLLKVYRRAQ
ncbi:MAG: Undecaprenyl phosphate-alpha-4-amino-4-deoxy-L-arabinose arabinosyl transferase [Herbaspirillum frisingense]|uniref:Undecaprenyl phosphate-alpha-4-amino-4-deoxy-L-arabinose arabinosyl transferase n=1 Tax=Herbaspirillum frisingense TaxID=92645 RepID=A0A7V8FZA7_9BURK|nr:MAG: Undecaprenyl phosphate-alpha-4-amino-4-deoxy-L-arabinose arabinosyl transferase [Herbaspirillum frisingense]